MALFSLLIKTRCISITMTHRLILLRERIGVYCEKPRKHVTHRVFNVTAGNKL